MVDDRHDWDENLSAPSPEGESSILNPQSPIPNRIELQVNGETHTCSPQTTLPQLLVQMGLNPRLLAVEYNGEILHRQFWDETEIKPNDRLEIVTIVGGG
jgi:sulfur carrier protein